MSLFVKKILFPILVFCAIFILTLYFIRDFQKTQKNDSYTLKSYKNTVALYKSDELVKTYNQIVLNTLPEKDIQQFNDGILVNTPEHADLFLEDFE